MDRTAMVPVIRDVVREVAGSRVRDDQTIVSSGLIDSLSVLTLIEALERRLGVRIPTAAVQPDDFDSVNVIADTIERVGIR